MKGGKNGQGRNKPLPYKERAKIKQREGPKRGQAKRDFGANEREVPRAMPRDRPSRPSAPAPESSSEA
jgi:hypothetical protein